MVLTASKLRESIYKVLDGVLETGVPVEIARRGRRLRIVAVDGPSGLQGLPRREVMKTDPEALVHLDWSGEWTAT